MPAPMAGLMSPLGRAARRAAASLPAFDIWLKADALSLSDGDPVALWPDSSGAGDDATQSAGSARPVYRTARFGSLPGVTFDAGSGQWLALTTPVVAAAGFALYAVIHYTGAGEFAPLGSDMGPKGFSFDGGNTFFSGDDGGNFPSASGTFSAGDYLVKLTRPNLATAFTLTATGYAPAALSGPNGAATTCDAVGLRFSFATGTLGELIACERALSAGEQTAVQSYLTAKWGLSLP